MREWAAKHPALLAIVVGAAVCSITLGAGLILGESLEDAIANAVFYGLIFGGGLFFISQGFPKTSAGLDENGQSLMYLRYTEAPPGSLRGMWEMGLASPAPGRIEFQPAIDDELIPSGRSRVLTGLGVMSPGRKAMHHDNKQGLPLGFQIVTVDSDGGVIEIAASPRTLQKIRQVVGPTS